MKKNKTLLFILIAPLILTSCKKASPENDTAQFIAQIKKSMTENVTIDERKILPPDLPEVHFVENKKRDPFVSLEPKAKEINPKGFLGKYEIKSLKLMGVMSLGDKTWAIIQTPDGDLVKVVKGMRIGYDQGLVTDITQDTVKLIIDTDVGKQEVMISIEEPTE